MNKMSRIAFILSFAAVICFVFSLPRAGAAPGGTPGPPGPDQPPGPEPPGQQNIPLGQIVAKKIQIVETKPMWEITQDGTDRSVNWVDYEPNPRFAIYDTEKNNYLDELDRYYDDVVLDKETGLVWTRCPQIDTEYYRDWAYDVDLCERCVKGKRMGWRLPSLEEIQTLFYPVGNTDEVALPPNHPFMGIEDNLLGFWTKSTDSWDPTYAQVFYFFDCSAAPGDCANVQGQSKSHPGPFFKVTWCVRGGRGHNTYSEPYIPQ